jgi:hypothetical protein
MAELHNVHADEPERPSLCPKYFSFHIRLEGETTFFPASTFALAPERAKELLQDRFGGKIAEFRSKRITPV